MGAPRILRRWAKPVWLTALLWLPITWPSALAQEFPVKPVRIVPGGGSDPLLRTLAPKLTESWGQQVIVDDRPGGAGLIAGTHVARAAPDGYTLLVATGTFAISPNFYKWPIQLTRDFSPITQLVRTPFAVVSHPLLPARSIAELVKLARSRPGEVTFGAGPAGSTLHLVGELFKQAAGIDLLHVPYKGLPAALTDIIAGQVQTGFTSPSLAMPQVDAKRLRLLALTSAQRFVALPDYPTLTELGYPTVVATGWYALLAPAATPKPVITRLHAEFTKALAVPEVRTRVLQLGLEPVASSPAECAAFLSAEVAKWASFIKSANIKIDTHSTVAR
jgi:tripartite-type tricarboxylate transporter receptor subunit TctC